MPRLSLALPDDAPKLEPLADGTGYRVRVRCGKARNRYRIPSTDPDFAAARAAALVEFGALLATQPPAVAHTFLTDAGNADGPGLARIRAAIAKLTGGVKVKPKVQNARALWTVRELGKAWTDGDLAKDFPDQIKIRRAVDNDISRLERHVYPVIGSLRVASLTLADIERVMSSLTGKRPTERKLSSLTRRTIALTLNRLLNLSVYPLKIRESSPIPKGLAPKAGKRRAMAYLYPDEDALLLACKPIPIRERLMWGFLVREGCSVSEALGLRWEDLDLDRGAVRLDKNKTDDPRGRASVRPASGPLEPRRGATGAAETGRDRARRAPDQKRRADRASGARSPRQLRHGRPRERSLRVVGVLPYRAPLVANASPLQARRPHGRGIEARRLEAARRGARTREAVRSAGAGEGWC